MRQKVFRQIEAFNRSIYVVGDINGNFEGLAELLDLKTNIHDAIVIVPGDCGIGSMLRGYYKKLYSDKLEPFLSRRNIELLCMRGNFDDPMIFNARAKAINFDYWKTVPDYSVIKKGTEAVMLIGGGITPDRILRIEEDEKRKQEKEGNSRLPLGYWNNEEPYYSLPILGKIKAEGINVTNVVSHVAPTFVYPLGTIDEIKEFSMHDFSLEEDEINSRKVLNKVFYELTGMDMKINNWYYSHYGTRNVSDVYGTRFKSMASLTHSRLDFEEIKIKPLPVASLDSEELEAYRRFKTASMSVPTSYLNL